MMAEKVHILLFLGASVPGRHIDRKGKGKEVVDETPGFEPDESKLPNEGHEKSANRHAGRGTANFKAGDQTASESGTLARKGKNYVIERIDKFTRTYVPRNLSNPSVDEFGNPQSPGFTFNLIQVNITKRDRFQ